MGVEVSPREHETVVRVSDEPTRLATFERQIAIRTGLQVATESTAAEALDRLADGDVVGVVADATLPDADGVTLLEFLRAARPALPVLLWTEGWDRETAARAAHARVTALLPEEAFGTGWPAVARLVDGALAAPTGDDTSSPAPEDVLAGALDGIVVLAGEQVRYENPAAGALLDGTDPRSLVDGTPLEGAQRPARELTADGGREVATAAVSVEHFRTTVPRQAGPPRDLDVTAAPVRWHDEPSTMLVVRDHREADDRTGRAERLAMLNELLRHDIRNDLQVILGRAELIRAQLDGDATAHLDNLVENALTAVELTETAGDLAETIRHPRAAADTVALDRTIERELEEVRTTFEDADVAVEGSLPAVTVCADRMLESVFRNLLHNAVQHNDAETPRVRVSVDLADEDDRVTVHVADNGPGIPDDYRETVFGRGETGLDSPGTGIGLYLVDNLVDQYGGSVAVGDNDPRGTVFSVTLPTADAPGG